METRALLARTLRSLDNCDDDDINFSFGNLEKSAKELSERLHDCSRIINHSIWSSTDYPVFLVHEVSIFGVVV